MARIVLLNKPYGVLSQFTAEGRWRSLADFIPFKDVYPAGRLDADSEGLLLLTDDGGLQHRITDPRHKLEKIYWAQVEGIPDDEALMPLRRGGVNIAGHSTLPCRVRVIGEPLGLWSREPPIRYRASIPTSWVEVVLREGKNRQVRRMLAAAGFPVLRLIRYAIGNMTIGELGPGAWRVEEGAIDFRPIKQ